MKKFEHSVKSEEGIHARPATLIVTSAKTFNSNITIKCKDKKVDAKRMIAIMSLNAKKNDILEVEIEGLDEQKAYETLLNIFKENI